MTSFYDLTAETLEGEAYDFSQLQGKRVVIVNTASKCGYTPQYEPLEALHQKYKDEGLVILGFPCNQFGRQEPGSAGDIREFCTNFIAPASDEVCGLPDHWLCTFVMF